MSYNILVVDDEKEIADLVAVYLENENFTVFRCYDASEALRYVETETLDRCCSGHHAAKHQRSADLSENS